MVILKFLISSNIDWITPFGLKATVGASYFDQQLSKTAKNLYRYSLKNTFGWAISYEIHGFAIDYRKPYRSNVYRYLVNLILDVKFLCLLAFKTSNLHLRKSII
jgi:hypothetical protein